MSTENGSSAEKDGDWGFDQKPGLSTETKIGLALALVLVTAFGFVLYRKLNKPQDLLANIKDPSQATAAAEPGEPEGRRQDEQSDEDPFQGGARPLPRKVPQQVEPENPSEFELAQHEPESSGDADAEFFASAPRTAAASPGAHPLRKPPAAKPASPAGHEFNPFAQQERSTPSSARTQTAAQAAPNKTEANEFVMDFGGDKPAARPAPRPLPANDVENPFGSEPPPATPKSRAAAASGGITDPFGNPVGTAAAANPAASPARAVPPPQEFPAFEDESELTPAQAAPVRGQPAAAPVRQTARPAPVAQFAFEPFPSDDEAEQKGPDPFDANAPSFEKEGGGVRAPAMAPLGRSNLRGSGPSQSLRPGHPDPGATPFDSAAPGGAEPGVHVVQAGENYWNIARKVYGAGRYYTALAEFNRARIPDPQRLQPGMKVLVPHAEILVARYGNLIPAGGGDETVADEPDGFFRDEAGRPVYRVGQRDTLTEIAQQHLGRAARWIQIYELNRERLQSPNDLKIGTVLRLPADASRVQVVQRPPSVR